MYANKAEKQRAYRQRKTLGAAQSESVMYERVRWLHFRVKMEAENGDPLAVKMLGRAPLETAWNLASFIGEQVWDYAEEHARDIGFYSKIPDTTV
jgi:ubiquinone biosynthesis protein COQ9